MMKIAFCSNFMNHHQEELSKALYSLTGGAYRFIACTPIEEERLRLGYADLNKKHAFILRPYESEAQAKEALDWCVESDVLIFGSGDEIYFQKRMEKNRLTFRYSERPLKKGTYRRFVPTTRKKIYNGFTKYKDKNLYVLCASAYASHDLALCGFDAKKCFKWGYFPKVQAYDIEKLMADKTPGSLLWVGRFIDWKHPEAAVRVAEYLRKKGKDFHLTMVGDGGEMPRIRKMIERKNLENFITLTGSMPADKVRTLMEKAEIFLATSDFQEGWGAVLNEAMNSGCALLANAATGAAPYLIQNGENGLLYKNGDIKALCKKTAFLLENSKKRRHMGNAAYETMRAVWNPENAADAFYKLAEGMQNGTKKPRVLLGPGARAEVLENNWYGKKS